MAPTRGGGRGRTDPRRRHPRAVGWVRPRPPRPVGGDRAVRRKALRSAIRPVISGIVLAAGSARRFGSTKQLVLFRGRPLAQHALDALASAGIDEIVVVTGHDADRVEAALLLPPQGRFVRNADHASGQSSSLAVGLHDLAEDSEGAVVLLADQPGVTDAEVRALTDAFEGRTEPHRAGSPTRTVPGRRCSPARSTPRPATCTATSALVRSWPRIRIGSKTSLSPSRPPPTSTARRTSRTTDQLRRRRTIVRSLGCSNPNRA